MVSRVDNSAFMISWYKRRSRSNTYVKSNLPLDEVEDASVMIWGFSSNRTETSFKIESLYQIRIQQLYKEHDKMNK